MNNIQKIAHQVGRHECGHYFVANALGIKAQDIFVKVIDEKGSHHGKTTLLLAMPLSSTAEIQKFILNRMSILYGGAIAESYVSGDVSQDHFETCLQNGAKGDCDKIQELAQLLRNISYPQSVEDSWATELESLFNKAIAQALKIIEKNIANINTVADKFSNFITTAGAEKRISKFEIESILNTTQRSLL